MPVAVKDQFNTAGILTTGGSSILKDNIPTEDATVITKLKSAGAVLLGKQNRMLGLQSRGAYQLV